VKDSAVGELSGLGFIGKGKAIIAIAKNMAALSKVPGLIKNGLA